MKRAVRTIFPAGAYGFFPLLAMQGLQLVAWARPGSTLTLDCRLRQEGA